MGDVLPHGHVQDLLQLCVGVHEGAVQLGGQGPAHGGLAAAGHAHQDPVLHPAAQGAVGLLGADGGDHLPSEELGGAPGLLGQHVQPPQVGDAQGLRLLQQSGAGGVIDEVQHPLTVGELAQVHRGCGGVGIHAHRGGVDDDGGVLVAVQVVIVVLPGAGDHHNLPRPQLPQNILGREAGPPRAQHQALPAQDADAALPHHALKAGRVGVVPQQGAVQLFEHGVHAADGGGGLGEVVADGQHGGLVGDGDVQALEIPDPEKVPQPVRGDLKKLVVVVAKEGVKGWGVAVPQFFSQQSASHQITSL